MIISKIYGDLDVVKDSFYFAADNFYFEKYGKYLFLSLKKHAPWANIHVHLFNPLENQIKWCKEKNGSCSYEFIDTNIHELKTYYACVRFIRIPDIFNKNSRIISLDCDSIAIKDISKDRFIEDTEISKILWREKQQMSLASSVFFGRDSFRFEYSKQLLQYFEKDQYTWFLDQLIMDDMVKNNKVNITLSKDWGNNKIKKTTLIWTGKGSEKTSEKFLDTIESYGNT